MKKGLTVIFLLISLIIKAQDTLVVMQYNLLNYGNYTNYCTTNNNNVSLKDGYIKTIINYIKPDIFSVNEMVAQEAMMEHLRGVLNETWTNNYKRPTFVYQNSDYLANTIYYNSEKLTFYSQSIAQNYIRDINVYKFYYNSPELENGDTAFIICITAHLKAGYGTDNENKRTTMAKNTMNYIASHNPKDNYLLMGDFNLYSDSEPAWHFFTMNSNNDISFNDPVNKSGNWHNNSSYKFYHTQSTHGSSNGCAATGGLDDRFDFILISNDIKNGTKKVKYITGSYRTVGQDGKHFNKGLLDSPTNNTVPSNVLSALYKNSDHLPITLKLKVDATVGINEKPVSGFSSIRMANPVNNKIKTEVYCKFNGNVKIALFDLTGKKLLSKSFDIKQGYNSLNIDVSMLKRGFYLLRFKDNNGLTLTKKLIKN